MLEVSAAARPIVRLPGGRLEDVIADLGSRTGTSIGLSDPALGLLRVPSPMLGPPVETSLRRMLRGLPACVRRIDDVTFRIERCATERRTVAPAPLKMPPIALSSDVVTIVASKRSVPLFAYPGSAAVLDFANDRPAGSARGTTAIVAWLPILSSTNLGAGRNKLFIRGVADSSFNGPTQASVGEYFGEIRLNYNAPDPDLTLYDVDRVEVLAGPQGTLYGIGSLGGVVKIIPSPVDLTQFRASVEAGYTATTHGAPGTDQAAMLNIPVVRDSLGVRAVVYRSIDGGYIDDVGRGLRDVNRTRIAGGRVTVRADISAGWHVELGGILQNIDSRDGQYADRALPSLQRRSAIAQPFDNDYSVGSVVIAGNWGRRQLTSASSATRHVVRTAFDFTPPGAAPTIFRQTNHISLFTNETRLSDRGADGQGWIIGTSLVANDERLTRKLGSLAGPANILGVRNFITDAAIFGEASFRINVPLTLTLGARGSFARLGGEALDERADPSADEATRHTLRLLPSAALAWHAPTSDLMAFMRLQQGFRPGGLAVSGNPPNQTVQRFQGDIISTAEIGLRRGSKVSDIWQASASVSIARWHHIQADLVGPTGLPYTTNIGDGTIIAAEAEIKWRPARYISVKAGAFLNESDLTKPATAFVGSEASALPNIPYFSGRLAIEASRPLDQRTTLSAGLVTRYVGRSRLGVGPILNIPQGGYFDVSANARLANARFGITLAIDNLVDTKANSFALGNPFTVAERMQTTPLRPRSFRVGLDARF